MTPRGQHLGEFEHLVLLALLHLGSDAYGASIRREIEARTGRSANVGAVYAALARMERKGWVAAAISEPEPRPGGRRRKHFSITADGREALRSSREVIARMSSGLGLGRGI